MHMRVIRFFFTLCVASLVGGYAPAALAQTIPPHLQQVGEVTTNTDYKYGFTVRWRTWPKTADLLSGFYVEWWDQRTPSVIKSTWTRASWDKPNYGWNGVQIQELEAGQKYSVRITPVDKDAKRGVPRTATNISPTGKYEKDLIALTAGRGFLYLPELDTQMLRPDPTKINTNQFGMRVAPAEDDPTRFSHSSVAVNHQKHWHMQGNDTGVGSITCRVQQPMILNSETRKLRFDLDVGPYTRAGWYIVLTPEKREQFKLFFNNGDDAPDSIYPQIRMKFASTGMEFSTYADKAQTAVYPTANVRVATYPNVRQFMGLDLSPTSVSILADQDYNGTLEVAKTYPYDFSKWGGKCYVYLVYSLYNNRKGQPPGINGYGAETTDNNVNVWHLGNIAFDGPAAKETVVPQAFDPIFHTMPSPEELHGWSIPLTKVNNPTSLWKGTVPVTVTGDNYNSAIVTGGYIPMKMASLMLGTNVAWSANLDPLGEGLLQYTRAVNIDSTKIPNGYYPVQFVTETVYGTKGVNNCPTYRFSVADLDFRVLVYNAMPKTTKPTITLAEFTDPYTGAKVPIKEGMLFPLVRGTWYRFTLRITTRAPIADFDLMGKDVRDWRILRSLHSWLALKSTDSTGLMTYEFNSYVDIWTFREDGTADVKFSFLDGDNNLIERAFVVQKIAATAPPPPVGTH